MVQKKQPIPQKSTKPSFLKPKSEMQKPPAKPKDEEKTQALEKVSSGAVTKFDDAPEWLQAGGGKGLENVDQADLIVPRIKLLQQMSPEVAETMGTEDPLTPGMMIDSITRENLGESFKVILLDHSKSRRLFEDLDKGGGLIDLSPDGVQNLTGHTCLENCPYKHKYNPEIPAHAWNEKAAKATKERKPSCVLFYDFPALMIPEDGPPSLIAFSCSSTKIKVAKNILTILRRKVDSKGHNFDIYATVWEIRAKQETAGNFRYFNFEARPFGWPTQEQYEMAKAMSESLRNQRYEVHHDAAEETEVPAGANGDDVAF